MRSGKYTTQNVVKVAIGDFQGVFLKKSMKICY